MRRRAVLSCLLTATASASIGCADRLLSSFDEKVQYVEASIEVPDYDRFIALDDPLRNWFPGSARSGITDLGVRPLLGPTAKTSNPRVSRYSTGLPFLAVPQHAITFDFASNRRASDESTIVVKVDGQQFSVAPTFRRFLELGLHYGFPAVAEGAQDRKPTSSLTSYQQELSRFVADRLGIAPSAYTAEEVEKAGPLPSYRNHGGII